MSKGSKRRPQLVDENTMFWNWHIAFLPKPTKREECMSVLTVQGVDVCECTLPYGHGGQHHGQTNRAIEMWPNKEETNYNDEE
jgi:hypothetical protein